MDSTTGQPARTRSNEGASQRVFSESAGEWHARAFARYGELLRNGDEQGALACASAALEHLQREFGTPPAMDRWIDALDHLLPSKRFPWNALEPFVFQAGVAVLGRRPAHPALPLWHARALACIRQHDAHPDHALRAAYFSFEYAVRAGDFRLAREIVQHARTHFGSASADVRKSWLEAEALEAWLAAEHARARSAVADALAAGGGYAAWEQGASAALSEGDLEYADTCLEAMRRTVDSRRGQDVAHMLFLNAARARLAGDSARASDDIDACLRVDATNVPAYFSTLWSLGRAHIDVARGRHRAAARQLGVLLGRSASHYWRFLEFSVLMSRTWLRIRQQRRAEASADLEAALALARNGGYRNCDPWWDPEAIDDIESFARGTPHDREMLGALVARVGLP